LGCSDLLYIRPRAAEIGWYSRSALVKKRLGLP
jgi:hypothetical protein